MLFTEFLNLKMVDIYLFFQKCLHIRHTVHLSTVCSKLLQRKRTINVNNPVGSRLNSPWRH